jgi:hypothetical protein
MTMTMGTAQPVASAIYKYDYERNLVERIIKPGGAMT